MTVRVLCLMFVCAAAQYDRTAPPASAPKKLININFLGDGYHAFEGNPHSEGRDPGFRQSVLDIQYTDSTSDGKWLIPDSVDVRESVMCGYQSDVDEIHTSEEYHSVLSADVKVGGSYGRFEFSSSVGYKAIAAEIASKHRSFLSLVAKCSAYEAFVTQMVPIHRVRRGVRNRTPISVTQLFRDAVANLPVNGSTSLYRQFIATFGTHYVSKVVMGAKVAWVYVFERSEWRKMEQSELDIGAGASASFIGASVDVSVLTSSQLAAKEKFDSFTSRVRQYYIGSRPPTDGRWETWAHNTAATPYPIEYELNEITDLLNGIHLTGFDENELTLKAKILSEEMQPAKLYGCPPGFEYSASGNRCYRMLLRRTDWTSAIRGCQSFHKDAQLVIIRNAVEQAAVVAFVTRQMPLDNCKLADSRLLLYTAGQRIDPSRGTDFVWKMFPTDGRRNATSSVSYTNWAASQPDYYHGDRNPQSCLFLMAHEEGMPWDDNSCTLTYFCSVCEIGPDIGN